MSLNPHASEFVPGQFSYKPPTQTQQQQQRPIGGNYPSSWEDDDDYYQAPAPLIIPSQQQQPAPRRVIVPPTTTTKPQQQHPAGPSTVKTAQPPTAVKTQPPAKNDPIKSQNVKNEQQQPQTKPAAAQPAAAAKPHPEPAKVTEPVVKATEPVLKTEKAPEPLKNESVLKSEDLKGEHDDLDDEDEGSDEELVPKIIADDPREHLNIVFIGHVDAGKSTISGNILYITGQVDARTIEKYEIEAKNKNRTSWFLAYIMDTNEEERAKGKTVEVGRAHFATTKKRYTILDAPGHKNYVPNMISGVSQADIAILVVSARKGEYEAGFDRSGQTREHALLAKTLGVKKLLIAINKMDDSTVNWSEDRFNFIKKNIGEWLVRDRIFTAKDVEWIPISGFDGSNLQVKVSNVVCPWYSGPPLLELLDTLQPLARMDSAPLRIPVLDRYREAGRLVVLGKIEAGVLRVGDTVSVVPGGNHFVVNQIENDAGSLTVAKPGENIRMIVKAGLDEESLSRGSVICPMDKSPFATTDFVGQIQILELLEHKSLFSAGYDCVLHLHTAVEEVSVTLLLEKLNPKTGKSESKLPKFVQSKDFVIAHLTTLRPIPMEKFDDFAQLGRFTLRDEGKTIAVGKILAPHAPIKRKKEKI